MRAMTTMVAAMSETLGSRLVTADGKPLPLEQTRLEVEARAGICRAVLTQTFHNSYAEPLRVSYKLPLPAGGAVAGFAFTVAGERIVGVVEGKAKARERFERALVEGRSAALLEQERQTLFSQEVGNIPAGERVTCEVTVDQKLSWLSEGAWEWRFPSVVAPRFLGEPGRVPDAQAVSVPVSETALETRAHFTLNIRDVLAEGARPESPSHALSAARAVARTEVTLAEGGARLDRDIVVRWKVATPEVGVSVAVAAGGHAGFSHGLVSLVPPSRGSALRPLRRDLIVLLDTSGSMGGAPLDQARAVTAALIDTLGDEDRLELVEFSDSPRRWKRGAVEATKRNKEKARAWLASLRASGGTQMREGILEALAPLNAESQRQVVLVTDGLIGFEREVIEEILHRLPPSSRVHTVGVGSAVNRSLTAPAARAGRGLEVVIGLGEDPERAAKELVARTDAPQVVGLSLSGSALVEHSPSRLPDLYAGAPALFSVKLKPEGGELCVRGRLEDGTFERTVRIPAADAAERAPALAALFARERVEDLEMELASGAPRRDREQAIENLGVDYQISTRLTSWVAVSEKKIVDPTSPTRSVEQPQEVPFGMSVEGLGLRAPAPAGAPMPMAARMSMRTRMGSAAMAPPPPPSMELSEEPMADFAEEELDGAAPSKKKEVSLGRLPPPSLPKGAPEPEGGFGSGAERAKMRGRPGGAAVGGGKQDASRNQASGEDRDDASLGGAQGESRDEKEAPASQPREQAERRASPAPAKPAAPAPKRSRRTRGRVVLKDAARLVLAILLAERFRFDPSRTVTLVLADGKRLTVPLTPAESTRGGEVEAGLELRLTVPLTFSFALDEVREVILTDDEGELTVELSS